MTENIFSKMREATVARTKAKFGESSATPSAQAARHPDATNDGADRGAFEASIKQQWDRDAGLREEFLDDFALYSAFARAEARNAVKLARRIDGSK